MVGYNLRYHSCVKKAKEWIDAGLIGRPLWANFTVAQWNNKPAYLRDGVILNWSHEIDLALYLLGPWGLVGSSTRISDGGDDITDILLNQSGCRTSIHLDYVTRPEVRQSIIVGDEATIIMDLVHRLAWLRGKGDNVMLDMHEGQDSWDENYIEEMQAFLDRLDGKEVVGCTGPEAFEVLKVCLQARKQAGL
jgi:predicted dehydrogenase